MDSMRNLTTTLAVPGLPEWSGLLILVVGLLCAAAFLMMPFSVFGVKARLEALEVQLDEIQAELRNIALRLGEPELPYRAPVNEEWVEPPVSYATQQLREPAPPRVTPPVLPPPAWPEGGHRSAPGARAEPRLDWPRNRG